MNVLKADASKCLKLANFYFGAAVTLIDCSVGGNEEAGSSSLPMTDSR